MAKSGQNIPHISQPEHFSGSTACGGWYPLELKAEERASTCVGQNSTQNPQALHRSTWMETAPRGISSSRILRRDGERWSRKRELNPPTSSRDFAAEVYRGEVTTITGSREVLLPRRSRI